MKVYKKGNVILSYKTYDELVDFFIKEKYSVSQELSIIRQKDVKNSEWLEYNNYCEQCKAKAKSIIESEV